MRHLTPSAFKFGPPQHQDPALSYSSMSLYPTSQRLTVQGGKISGQQQEHSMVGKEGAAEPSESEPQAQTVLPAETPSDMCENVLLKTLHNLVVEAVRAEFGPPATPDSSHR